jgi:hypothetical protein
MRRDHNLLKFSRSGSGLPRHSKGSLKVSEINLINPLESFSILTLPV